MGEDLGSQKELLPESFSGSASKTSMPRSLYFPLVAHDTTEDVFAVISEIVSLLD